MSEKNRNQVITFVVARKGTRNPVGIRSRNKIGRCGQTATAIATATTTATATTAATTTATATASTTKKKLDPFRTMGSNHE